MHLFKNLVWMAAIALVACSTPGPKPKVIERSQSTGYYQPPRPDAPFVKLKRVSEAASPRDYRRDAAEHLYQLNQDRIFHGSLPPLLKAVAVTRVQIDDQGLIQHFEWMRAPSAPDIMAEIERTMRSAQPYPKPTGMGGQVAYIDTWLWHRNNRFQLDTLTAGQRDRK